MKRWVLTIYTKHPGGNPVLKHKSVKFDVVGAQPATKYFPNQLNRLKRVEKLHRLKSQPIFLKLPKRNGANHLIFQPKYPVFFIKMVTTRCLPPREKYICWEKKLSFFPLQVISSLTLTSIAHKEA